MEFRTKISEAHIWIVAIFTICCVIFTIETESSEKSDSDKKSASPDSVSELEKISRPSGVDDSDLVLKEILKVREDYRKRGHLTRSMARKVNKLVEGKSKEEVAILRRIFFADPQNAILDEPNEAIEEVVVTWRPFEFVPDDPAEFSVMDLRHMRNIRGIANTLYREGKYGEAFPLLLSLAKRGFKDAQSRLAYIFFNGAGGVQKSNLRALGWLGVAAQGRTEPGFKVLYSKYYNQIPDESKPIVDRIVSLYQERFGFPEHLDCSTEHRFASGIIKKTYCRFKLEAIANAQAPYRSWADKVNLRSK